MQKHTHTCTVMHPRTHACKHKHTHAHPHTPTHRRNYNNVTTSWCQVRKTNPRVTVHQGKAKGGPKPRRLFCLVPKLWVFSDIIYSDIMNSSLYKMLECRFICTCMPEPSVALLCKRLIVRIRTIRNYQLNYIILLPLSNNILLFKLSKNCVLQ